MKALLLIVMFLHSFSLGLSRSGHWGGRVFCKIQKLVSYSYVVSGWLVANMFLSIDISIETEATWKLEDVIKNFWHFKCQYITGMHGTTFSIVVSSMLWWLFFLLIKKNTNSSVFTHQIISFNVLEIKI